LSSQARRRVEGRRSPRPPAGLAARMQPPVARARARACRLP
jgi:hypothetical protein